MQAVHYLGLLGLIWFALRAASAGYYAVNLPYARPELLGECGKSIAFAIAAAIIYFNT